MSIVCLSHVMRHSEATGGARLVIFVLAEHAHDDGTETYPAVDTIAERARMSRRGVQGALRRLEQDGCIARDGLGPAGQTKWRVVMGGAPSAPREDDDSGGRTSRPEGGAPRSPEPSCEPSGKPSGGGGSAGAGASDEVPDDFPDELRPHAKIVYKVLLSVAEHHNAKAVSPKALAHVIMARPRHPLVKAAYDFAAWAFTASPRRDVVAGYRNWLDKCSPLAGTEHLPGDGPALPENVHRIGSRPMSNAERVEAQIQAIRGAQDGTSAGSSDTFGST